MQVFERDSAELPTFPTLDEYGLLRQGSTWVALSPIEARLVEAFLSHPGKVVSRSTLARAGWPEGVPSPRSVDSRIKALRKRVSPLAMRIFTVRGHGYLAEFNAAD